MEYISPHTRASNSTLNSSSLGHSNTLHRKKSLRKSLSRRNTISTVRSASAHSFASSVVNKASTFQSPPIRRKLLIVGDGGTGKTSMLSFYSTGLFQEEYTPTIFENYITSNVIDEKPVELALWDTAGQEDYNRLRLLSYPDSDCIILCFCIDMNESVENILEKWMPEIKQNCPDAPILLVGLKADLRDNFIRRRNCITVEHGQQLAESIGAVNYIECSAKTGEGVYDVVNSAARVSLLPKSQQRRNRSSKNNGNNSASGGKCVIQ